MKISLLTIGVVVFLPFLCVLGDAQIHFSVMSYNVENLFDTVNDPLVEDDEFTPAGNRFWTKSRYYRKLQHVAQVIQAAGEWTGVALVGLCEVENDSVVEHLLRRTPLYKEGYQYCMTHGCDKRGINVALLYQRDQFRMLGMEELHVPTAVRERPTRNILHVWGEVLSSDTLDVFVCHLPSRYGGELASRKRRKEAVGVLKKCIDSLFFFRKSPKILVMGDFNDTPQDETLEQELQASSFHEDNLLEENRLYNLFYEASGSHKYQGEWNQLDHILVNGALLQEKQSFYVKEGSAHVFAPSFLLKPDKTWRGIRPFRTYYGFKYEGGYSDHLPLRVTFICKGVK